MPPLQEGLKAGTAKLMAKEHVQLQGPSYMTICRYGDPKWLIAKSLHVLAGNYHKCGNGSQEPEYAEWRVWSE